MDRFGSEYCSNGCDRLHGPCCDLCGDCRAAEQALGRTCCVLAESTPLETGRTTHRAPPLQNIRPLLTAEQRETRDGLLAMLRRSRP